MPKTFDRDLFDEVVHYIAWRMRDADDFGRVKLAKTLFYADFTAYAEEGDPLTGARYFHWPQGPFTTEIYRAEERLVQSGVAKLKDPEVEFDTAKLSADAFSPKRLEGWQLSFLDIKMDQVAETGAAGTVSEKSHEHPGWQLTRDKQEIPYAAVHISREGPTQADVKAAEEVARENGWV